jgi:hypothetical protein
MRGRPATGGDQHVDQREATGGLLARQQDRVGVADHGEVHQVGIVGARDGQRALQVVVGQAARGPRR